MAESLQLQKSIAALMRETGPQLGDLHWRGSTGLGEEGKDLGAARGGNGHAGGSAHSQEADGTWLVWREGPGEMAGNEAAGVGS